MTPTSLYSFQIAVARVGGGNAAALHMCLSSAWDSPGRSYHTRQHLNECLALVKDWADELTPVQCSVLTLAVWFHDAVYDPRRSGNEEQSALIAFKALRRSGVAEEHCARIRDLIRATDHVNDVPVGDKLTDLLLDIDLAILGAPAERFAEYQSQVRDEYNWVPAEAYAVGRGAVLEKFKALACAAQPSLYRTSRGQQLNGQAAANLTGALA